MMVTCIVFIDYRNVFTRLLYVSFWGLYIMVMLFFTLKKIFTYLHDDELCMPSLDVSVHIYLCDNIGWFINTIRFEVFEIVTKNKYW